MKFCIRCGTRLVDGVCPKCGFVDDHNENVLDTNISDGQLDDKKDPQDENESLTGCSNTDSKVNGTYDNGQQNNVNQNNINQNSTNQNNGNNQYNNGSQYSSGSPYNSYGNPYSSGNNMQSSVSGPGGDKNHTKLIAILLVLLVAFIVVIIFAVIFNLNESKENNDSSYMDSEAGTEEYAESYDESETDESSEQSSTADSDEYYSFHDDIKDNLDYTVSKKYFTYKKKAFYYIDIEYPVITSDSIKNIDELNAELKKDTETFQNECDKSYSKTDTSDQDGNNYFVVNECCYITYMDEDYMSVAFSSQISTDESEEDHIKSVNIDMKDGKIIKNTDILNVDKSFADDLRERSEQQNGDSIIAQKEDDELIKSLESDYDLIVLRTPLGMEIGINDKDYGWTTVTYKDYENCLK